MSVHLTLDLAMAVLSSVCVRFVFSRCWNHHCDLFLQPLQKMVYLLMVLNWIHGWFNTPGYRLCIMAFISAPDFIKTICGNSMCLRISISLYLVLSKWYVDYGRTGLKSSIYVKNISIWNRLCHWKQNEFLKKQPSCNAFDKLKAVFTVFNVVVFDFYFYFEFNFRWRS